ncbi:ubiquitin-like small modifier protein 1 [Halorubrum trueperi]|uniref:Ubiquitin-like small modifier protein 1 n=1 Tax=Halorubrum trueperi TaxID=2004704 RepID=A0ABD5UKR5_9EURY
MHVECKLFGPFRDDAGVENVGGENDPGTTVGELLRALEAKYPPLAGRIVDPDGDGIQGSTVVSVNKKYINHLDGLSTELEEGDVVRIAPAVSGG